MARSGHEAAEQFDDFYRSCASRLTGQLFLLTRDREEARDCVQEAFGRAWARWDHVRELEHPEAWVRTVARRLAISRWRKTRNAIGAWGRWHEGATHQVQHELDDRIGLVHALQRLPLEQRTALVLYHLCDLDVAAIAAETLAPASTVKSRLARGRVALSALMPDWHSLHGEIALENGTSR